MKTRNILFTIVVLLAVGASCNRAESEDSFPTIPSEPIRITTPTPEQAGILPQALYYLAGRGEASQIWRLETDSTSKQQITHVPDGIQSFAVSPVDGRLAYVSNNQLFLADEQGEAGILIADGQAVDVNVADYVFRSEVSSPVFSPDGQILAYGFDGLHLYYLASGEDQHLLTNLGNLLGEPFVFTKEAYAPGAWAPDGRMLLIIMGYYEGSTLAILDLDAEQPFRRLWSDGTVCCTFEWTADGKTVLVANPYFTTDLPGLWRFDAETGAQTELVSGLGADGWLHYAGWPTQLASGELYYFYVQLERFSPDTGIPLTLVRSAADGTQPEPLRPEIFRISDVVWTPDNSAAIILQYTEPGQAQINLVKIDGSPIQILAEGPMLRNLSWGP